MARSSFSTSRSDPNLFSAGPRRLLPKMVRFKLGPPMRRHAGVIPARQGRYSLGTSSRPVSIQSVNSFKITHLLASGPVSSRLSGVSLDIIGGVYQFPAAASWSLRVCSNSSCPGGFWWQVRCNLPAWVHHVPAQGIQGVRDNVVGAYLKQPVMAETAGSLPQWVSSSLIAAEEFHLAAGVKGRSGISLSGRIPGLTQGRLGQSFPSALVDM